MPELRFDAQRFNGPRIPPRIDCNSTERSTQSALQLDKPVLAGCARAEVFCLLVHCGHG